MDQDQKKLNAARASLDYIESGIVLGVGTGSTVNHLIELLPSVKDKRTLKPSRGATALTRTMSIMLFQPLAASR